ncbi:MAG: tRNA epoxyqueuosine(34) reductase QueG [Bacteroidota bacterium]|nr:tRNA epoxyqueuosine(34) reductase QueG [Bacteroidota bacterium]
MQKNNKKEITLAIKKEAKRLAFVACGISKVSFLENEAKHFDKYLKEGRNAKMDYLANNISKRKNPQELVENSKSVISLLLNYYPQEKQNPDTKYQISKYAYGRDYHKVLKKKLKSLTAFIEKCTGEKNARFFVDTAPVFEKAWAEKSGIGWIGKNTLLINQKYGSFVFLGEIIIDLELNYDQAIEEQCGSCTKCIDACPTNALIEAYKIDSNKCISYQTIENNNPSLNFDTHNWVYGCDICQNVCPYNKEIPITEESDFLIKEVIKNYTDKDWKNLDEKKFEKIFNGTAVRRLGYKNFMRNF